MNLSLPSSRLRFRKFSNRAVILLAVHAVVFGLAYFAAFFTRNDFQFESEWLQIFAITVGGVVAIKLVIF